ncbi:MAG: MBL fold metallo-hydrolase [Bacteroidales bacterium]
MEVTILGTGTSQGVPVIACECAVCRSDDPKDKRLRTAAMISQGSTVVAIDAGPDFRQQMIGQQVKHLDAVLITHGHKDHTGGLDDVRAFNWVQKKHMDIYARHTAQDAIKREFPYAFGESKYPGAPDINLHSIPNETFQIGLLSFTPIEAMHQEMPVVGFRSGSFSYLTDASEIQQEELDKMKGSRIVVINALRQEQHHSHFSLDQAVELLQYLRPEKGYLTHISHQMGLQKDIQRKLPENIFLAWDGLKFSL